MYLYNSPEDRNMSFLHFIFKVIFKLRKLDAFEHNNNNNNTKHNNRTED